MGRQPSIRPPRRDGYKGAMTAASPETTAALRDQLAALLAFLDDPEAGRRVYDAFAPDAPVYTQLKIVPRKAIDREDFHFLHAAGFRMFARDHADQPRQPSPTGLVASAATHDGDDRIVAWYEATERHGGRSLHLAAGWVRAGEAWKLHWLTLAKAPGAWTFATGHMQTIADFTYGEAAVMVAPRSWLDVAWHRLYGRPEPAITALPEERFSCQMSTRCCKIGFKVDVPAPAQAVLDAIDFAAVGHPELAGTRLPAQEGGGLTLKGEREQCRFLDGHGHCILHKAAGRALFPICATYPFQLRPTPDGLAVTTSLTCGSVRGNLGEPIDAQPDEIWTRLAISPPSEVPTRFYLGPGMECTWAEFKEAEAVLLGLMARADLPLPHRLWLGERYLFNRVAGLPFEAEAEASRPIPAAPAGERARWIAFLATYAGRLGVTLPEPPAALGFELGAPQEALLVRMLRALLFEKGYAFAQDLTTAHHVVVFQFALAAYMRLGYPDRHIPDDMMWWLAGAFQHEPVYTTLARDREETMRLLATLGDPGFGMMLLGVIAADGVAAEAVAG